MRDLFTWIDTACGVCPSMWGHAGGCMSFGKGSVHSKSSKMKSNTKSSIESELVGMNECAPYNTWMSYFMKEQGYELKDNVAHQDNKSAALMETNGRNSCSGNSRHITIRCFFVKDRIDNK